MNNDFLAGILSGLTGTVPPVQKTNAKSNMETGDFMSLLRDRLAFDADTSSGSTQSTSNFSFRAKSNNGNLNPLLISGAETKFMADERPTAAIRSETNQENDARSDRAANKKIDEQSRQKAVSQAAGRPEQTEKVNDELKQAEIDATEAKAQADAAEEAATATGEAAQASAASDQLAAMQNLIESFDPEQQEALIAALQQLSPQDLKAIAGSPEDFRQTLLALAGEMPASDQQQNLMDMLNSPEFAKLLEQMSENIKTIMAGNSEHTGQSAAAINAAQVMQKLTEAIAGSETSTEAEDNALLHQANAATLQDGEIPGDEAVDGTAETDSTKETDAEQTSKEKGSKHQDKADVDESFERKLQALQQSEKTGERESLRQEFKRVNEAQSESDPSMSSPDGSTAEQTSGPAVTAQNHAAPAEVKTAIEDAARKFFTMLGDKTATASEKPGHHAFSAASEGVRKPVQTSNSSNNSGMNNGFSFQSGASSSPNATARAGAPVPVTNAAFSELLQKAEFVKTKDGSKVLNIELDPKELGKVEMELTSRDGTVTARISAENAVAKAKLDELAPQIKEQLISQGVNLSEITVDISSRDPDEGNRNQMSGGKNKSGRISALKNKEDADAIIRKNILPNLRRAALNIQAVDTTV